MPMRVTPLGEAMKAIGAILCLGMLVGSAASALAKPAYVLATVNLRAAPGTTNAIVGKIPGGSLVDTDGCTAGWCAVTWQDKKGFAIETSLDLSGRVPLRPAAPLRQPAPPPGYIEDDGPTVYYVEAPPPPYYYYRGPYYRPYWGWRRYGW